MVRSLVARWTATVIPAGYRELGPVTQLSTGYWWNGYSYERSRRDAEKDLAMRARWTDPANWRDVRFAAILTVTAGLTAAVPPAGVVAAVLGFAQSRPLLGIIGLVVAVGSAPYAWRVFGPVAVRFLRSVDGGPHQRNLTIFADGEADRSPCGSGTSARPALLHDEGRLGPGQVLRHDSIVGTTFLGRVVEESADGVITEVEGAAYRTGTAIFTLDPRDPVGTGFSLR